MAEGVGGAPASARPVEATGLSGGSGAVALTLHEAAELVGAYRWIEERLFALTGRWSADPAMTPAGQLHLFEVSSQHAWHADLWSDRLPMLDGVDREALTRPRGPVLERLLGALEEETVPAARLAGLYRVVLPELGTAYRRHLGRAVRVTDGPFVRTLRLALADHDAEQVAGEAVLTGVLAADAGTAGEPGGEPGGGGGPAAAGAVRRLEQLLAGGAGGGPVRDGESRLLPWPGEGPVRRA